MHLPNGIMAVGAPPARFMGGCKVRWHAPYECVGCMPMDLPNGIMAVDAPPAQFMWAAQAAVARTQQIPTKARSKLTLNLFPI